MAIYNISNKKGTCFMKFCGFIFQVQIYTSYSLGFFVHIRFVVCACYEIMENRKGEIRK